MNVPTEFPGAEKRDKGPRKAAVITIVKGEKVGYYNTVKLGSAGAAGSGELTHSRHMAIPCDQLLIRSF